MKQCTCFALKAINCICDQREDENSFAYWFYKEPHRIKYLRDHPAYLAAQEAWEESKKVAKNFYKNKTNYTNGSTYFNHKSLGVKYKTNVKPVKYGNHIFY